LCHFYLLSATLILILPCSYAQNERLNIKFDNISIKDGLSQSSPNCIYQDSRGFLWIGTEDGLNKYDGYEFKVYKPEQNNIYGISNPRILSLCEDPQGNLWIGTNGGGLNKYDRETDKFYHFYVDEKDSVSLAGSVVSSLLFLDGGILLAGTEHGPSLIDTKSGKIVPLAPAFAELQQLEGSDVNAMESGFNGLVWFGTSNGLFRYDPEKKQLFNLSYLLSKANPNLHIVTALLADSRKQLWIGTETGLARLDEETSTIRYFESMPVAGNSVSNRYIKALLEDDTGKIWIGTFGGGLNIFLPKTGAFVNYAYDYNNPYSLSNNEVLSIYRDFSGIIWVGTNGLDRFNPKKEKFTLYDYVPYTRDKLVFRNIHPIYEDRRGVLWIGSKTDGVHILDRINKEYNRLIHDPGSPISISSNRVRAICEYPEGTIWVGTDDEGLNRVFLDEERKPYRIEHYGHEPSDPNSLTSNKIYAFFVDKEGRLWIGTDNGLTIMDINSEAFTQYLPDKSNPNSLSNATVFCIYGDRSGNIWLATDLGINKYDPDSGGFIRYLHNEGDTNSVIHDEILSFYEDANENLWIGTYGKGLDRFDRTKNIFHHYTSYEQLSKAVVYGILEDDDENLWLSTNNGIIKFSIATGELNQFTIEDGLQSNEFNGTSYFKSRSSEMFFGGQYGFNSFYPNQVILDSVPPKVVLTDLQVLNVSVIPGKDAPISRQITEAREIILNHKQNNFTLYYSALHFGNPSHNKYKYKLEGFDDEWIDVGNKRFVSYTSLPYKSYTFRVIASNCDGIWNETGLSVKIKVKPPFWSTVWFRILLILFIIAVLVYLVKKRLDIVQRQKRIFEDKFRESSLELQEAQHQLEKQHDEIVIQKRELKLREKDQENLLWFNQGLGMFSELISKNKDDIKNLCQVFIERLVEYVEAQQGGIYLLNDEQEKNLYLELVAHYAFNIERTSKHFLPGEGYVGTCFHERQFIEVDNLTETYSLLHSGLGQEYLKHILLAPLKINDQCIGVVEIGSFRKIKGYRVSFIDKLLETFSSIINTEQSNAKLKKLIDYSTIQARELAEREDQLRMNLEEIMATQEESARREDELIKLAEESASREEMLNQEIEALKAKIEQLSNNH
jgi:ligand-binding sensor domain-containing protein